MGYEAKAAAARAGELAERAYAEAAPRVERAVATSVEVTRDVTRDVAVPAVASAVGTALDTVGEALETSRIRGGAAWDALRGGPVGPPVAVRRWPWAVAAAVLGAAAGAALAQLVGRVLLGRDAPDAQEPEDLQAVVDRPAPPATGPAAEPVPGTPPSPA